MVLPEEVSYTIAFVLAFLRVGAFALGVPGSSEFALYLFLLLVTILSLVPDSVSLDDPLGALRIHPGKW